MTGNGKYWSGMYSRWLTIIGGHFKTDDISFTLITGVSPGPVKLKVCSSTLYHFQSP